MQGTRQGARGEKNFAVETLVRTLRSYGVLTEERLAELSGGRHWPGRFMFKDTLHRAVAEGRISKLADGLYELSDSEAPSRPPAHLRPRQPGCQTPTGSESASRDSSAIPGPTAWVSRATDSSGSPYR